MNQCLKCKSDKIIPRLRIMDRGQYGSDTGDLSVVAYKDPDALVFRGACEGALFASVCGECGFTELYAENPRELYEAYRTGESGSS